MDKIADKESNGPSISHKEDNATLAAYFKEVLPDYDEERVYPSDIKKIVNWYNMLESKGLVVDEEPAIPPKRKLVVEDVEAKAKKKKKLRYSEFYNPVF
jgi:hypothetical protein